METIAAESETVIAEGVADKLRLFSMVAGVYITPVVCLRLGLIPYRFRFHVLIAMAIVAVAFAALRYSAHGLGLGRPRLLQILGWSVIPSALLIAGIFWADLPHRLQTTQRLPFYLFFVLLSAPAQEFLYRSFLFAELAAARIPRFGIVVISAGLYSFMHTIARDGMTTLLTFVVGLIWAAIFLRTRNFFVVALSHAGLGVAAITLGVI
jgi:membrane protease YdiL (CAAX protease family)